MIQKRLLPLCCALLLCGCTHTDAESSNFTSEQTAPQSTTIPVVVPKETEAPAAETEPASPVIPEQTPDEILESYAENDPMQFQGGIGGEEHAETPLPEYFRYRFDPTSVAMRLAGGTYQVISYDFSQTFAHESYYYLRDHNEDGYFDLYAPIEYDGDYIVTCAVFLWNPESGKFADEPVLYECPPNSKPIKDNLNEE